MENIANAIILAASDQTEKFVPVTERVIVELVSVTLGGLGLTVHASIQL